MDNVTKLPFFSQLNEEQKEELISMLRPIKEKKGHILHYQGDTCENSLLLTKGEVRLFSQADNLVDEITLYTLKAGEQCLSQIIIELNDSSAIPSAIVESDIEGYLINRVQLEDFIAKIPAYQEYIISLYAKKVVDLTMAMQRLKFKNLDDRILDYLHRNKKKTIQITHQALAEKMHTSRTVVSRVLKKLEENGDLKLHRGYIEF